MMQKTTLPLLSKNLDAIFNQVVATGEAMLVERGEEPSMVLLSAQEYGALMATAHEMSSAANVKRLDAAIEKMKHPKASP